MHSRPLACALTNVLAVFSLVAATQSFAAAPSEQHAAFIQGLQELDDTSLPPGWKQTVGLRATVKSVSKPRAFRPVVSRFKGWYIDSAGSHQGADEDSAVDSLIMAKTERASSYWQLVETDQGYVIVAAGGAHKGRVLSVDQTVEPRPEGPKLTVVECLRLTKQMKPTSFWKVTHTERGVVIESLAGKFKNWCWDFGGRAESRQEQGREVAHNVLLAERVVDGSYYDVEPKP